MTSQGNRVAVTGIGVVTAIGHDVSLFWENCLNGVVCLSRTPEAWKHYYVAKSHHWSTLTLPDFLSIGMKRSDILLHDIAALNIVYAAEKSLAQSRLVKTLIDERNGRYSIGTFDSFRCGVFVGTGLGCITSTFDNYVPHIIGKAASELSADACSDDGLELFRELADSLKGQPRVSPVAATKCMANSISSLLSLRFGLRGANETCIAACAAGSIAIERAYDQIRKGKIDFALAGGTEYYGDRAGGVFMAFDRLNTLAKPREGNDAVNRPFDAGRTGFLFSQGGACILSLENMSEALARGAQVLAELKGASSTSDAYSLAALDPNGEAIQRMMVDALLDADVSNSDIKYINTHGTGTIQNDELEARIIGKNFPGQPLLNSTKSILGHTIGACGALEAAVAILSVANNEVHPSLNLESPIRDLNFATKRQISDISCALSLNFGFGGHNVGLVFSKF